jgi:DNA-binding NtrC family response regulator
MATEVPPDAPVPAGDDATWARLTVVYPRSVVDAVALPPVGRSVLGRDPAGPHDHAIVHTTVSREHLELQTKPGNLAYACDHGSRNGTWIDGNRLMGTPVALRDGMVVRLGDVLAVFETGEGTSDLDGPQLVEAVPGRSATTARLRAAICRAAPESLPTLVVGEAGTGKERVVEELHRLSGRAGPLLTLNCAHLSLHDAEVELFGHVRGAFPGAETDRPGLLQAATGGTLCLQDVGELPFELQPKLLRAVETGEIVALGATDTSPIDVRIIAATQRVLAPEVEAGGFRRDLYATLSHTVVRVPSIRRRRADVFEWIDRLAQRWAEAHDQPRGPVMLTPDAAEQLLRDGWPQNLHGLDQLVHTIAEAGFPEPISTDMLSAWTA